MALVTKPNTFTAGGTIIAAEHNSNFDILYNDYNGNITDANIVASASIQFSKLKLSDDVTFTGDIAFTNGATIDDAFTITVNSLTTGGGVKLTSSSSDASQRKLWEVINDDSSAKFATCIAVVNDASSNSVSISARGNGPHITMLGDPSPSPPKDGDLWFTGSQLNFRSGNSTVDLMQSQRGWINFNGAGTIAIQDSFNVSSIGDNGNGKYKVIWDTDFANTAHAVVGSCGSNGGATAHFFCVSAISTTDVTVQTSAEDGTYTDQVIVCVMAIGHQ